MLSSSEQETVVSVAQNKKNIHNKVRPQAMDIAVFGAESVDFTVLPPPIDF